MKTKTYLHLMFLTLFTTLCHAQISPPGLGDTQTAFWSAVGVRQDLDSLHKNRSLTYFGLGRISNPESGNPFKEQSILVVNQEFYHTISPRWQYSYALSYRRQNQYENELPFSNEIPAIHQEFRIYGRIAHTIKAGNLKWKTLYRQEVRKFFGQEFTPVPEGFRLRSRIKTQASLSLSEYHSLVASAEALFAVSHDSSNGWGSFGYNESRFCVYYCYTPKDLPVTLDIGYMNNLIGYGSEQADASYLAFDIILENVF